MAGIERTQLLAARVKLRAIGASDRHLVAHSGVAELLITFGQHCAARVQCRADARLVAADGVETRHGARTHDFRAIAPAHRTVVSGAASTHVWLVATRQELVEARAEQGIVAIVAVGARVGLVAGRDVQKADAHLVALLSPQVTTSLLSRVS